MVSQEPAGEILTLSNADLVERARAGDEAAWSQIIDRMKNVVWKTVNGFGLRPSDAEDAFAATLFRLAENLDNIRDPERLPGWLATTARNESLTLLRVRRRTVVVDQVPDVGTGGDNDSNLMLDDLKQAVREAFETLSQDCQRLLRVLSGDPPMAYRDVADHFAMPIGSIGATRQRCLQKLRSGPSIQTYLEGRT